MSEPRQPQLTALDWIGVVVVVAMDAWLWFTGLYVVPSYFGMFAQRGLP